MTPINILNKTKIRTIMKYLGNEAKEKFDHIKILLDEMENLGYQAGSSLTKYDNCISISVYFKSINVFILSIREECLRIDLARRNEAGTVPMKHIPIVEKIIKKTIFCEKPNHVEYLYTMKNEKNDIGSLLQILQQTAMEINENLENEFGKLDSYCSFLLNEASFVNYKLYKQVSLNFSPNVNLFIGDNGNGKTAFLNAVFHLISAFQYMFTESKNYNRNKISAEDDIHFEIEYGKSGLLNIKKEKETNLFGDIMMNNNHYEILRGKKVNGGAIGSGSNKELEHYIEQIEIANKYFCTPVLPVFAFFTTNRLLNKENNMQKLAKNRFEIYNETIRSRNNISGVTQFIKDCFIEQEKYQKSIPAFIIIKNALEMAYKGLLEKEQENKTVELKYYFNRIVLCVGEQFIPLEQMSDGYQAVLGIVADLAYRIIILNPNTMNVLKNTPGIVLIDEIDLHLHPKWQKKFLGILKEIFPKIQIIATTHSPFVIQSLKPKDDKLFILRDNEIHEAEISDYYGLEDTVFSYMGVKNPTWSEYKMQEFISYKEFMDLYDQYLKESNAKKRNALIENMNISLKQNNNNIEVFSRLKSKMDIVEELEKEKKANETS